MSAANCTVRGPGVGGKAWRDTGAVRLRLTAPYAGSFTLTAVWSKATPDHERKSARGLASCALHGAGMVATFASNPPGSAVHARVADRIAMLPRMRGIYLDYNASTPIAPQVVDVMSRALRGDAFGNPSSGHWAGQPARATVQAARARVAALLGCKPEEIVFTSGGSESNNLALKGLFFACRTERPRIITTQIEHPAIIEPCRFLERLGARITWLPVDATGCVDPDDLRRAITLTPDTLLVSIMHANNEVGSIQPIRQCAAIAREHGVPFHTDAAQSVGKINTRVDDLGVDLLTLAAHKFHGPKGIGALYVRSGTLLEPLIHGAAHESGRRAGTESALLTAAMGEACVLASDLTPMRAVATLRDHFRDALADDFGNRVVFHGNPDRMLPNTLSVSFLDAAGTEVLASLHGVAATTGSACHSGRVELSPVLRAMGVSPETGRGTVRFSLGRETTAEEIESVLRMLSQAPWRRGRTAPNSAAP